VAGVRGGILRFVAQHPGTGDQVMQRTARTAIEQEQVADRKQTAEGHQHQQHGQREE
jgi:hypothetical protein